MVLLTVWCYIVLNWKSPTFNLLVSYRFICTCFVHIVHVTSPKCMPPYALESRLSFTINYGFIFSLCYFLFVVWPLLNVLNNVTNILLYYCYQVINFLLPMRNINTANGHCFTVYIRYNINILYSELIIVTFVPYGN